MGVSFIEVGIQEEKRGRIILSLGDLWEIIMKVLNRLLINGSELE